MGVDYDANYGFGVQVEIPTVDDKLQYLEDLCKDTKFSYFVEGSYYDNDEDYYYIISDEAEEAMENGDYNIVRYVNELLDFLVNNNITYIGNPRIVGGLLIS